MDDMAGFKITLIATMRRNSLNQDRAFFEAKIASWNLLGYLTEPETEECVAVLDECFPLPVEE